MKKILFIMLAVLTVTFSFPQAVEASNSSTTIVNQNDRTLEGTVVDEEGIPMMGVTVTVYTDKKKIITTTDCDGHYKFNSIPDDADYITCEYLGYTTIGTDITGYATIDFIMTPDEYV